MLNSNRRDRIADPADTANSVLKPAIYDPPGASARCAVQYPTASPRYFISSAGSDLQSEATIRDMMLHD